MSLDRRLRRVALAVAPALVAALAGCGLVSGQTGPAQIRVDQVGYAPGGAQTAYLMAARADDAPFEVVDEAGAVVLRGTAGADRGRWSDAYPAVHPLDLGALRAPGRYRVLVTDPAAASPWFTVADDPHRALVDRAVTFFQAQRDGPDVVRAVLRRAPAHLTDRAAQRYAVPAYDGTTLDGPLRPVGGRGDVSGGWYDAGDYLKFTHTASYAAVVLLLARRTRAAGPDTPLAREAAHGLAWLDRMYDARAGVLYAQVGIGDGNDTTVGDHDRWRLPEADDRAPATPGDPARLLTRRPVFPANAPGARISGNLAGRVTAALALGAQLAAPAEARRLLDRAATLYARADGRATVTTYPAAYYTENSAADDLALAGAELALAARRLGDPRAATWRAQALRWAAAYAADDSPEPPGAADVGALAAAELLPQAPEAPAATRDALLAAVRRPLDAARDRAAGDPFGAGMKLTEFDAVPRAFGLAAAAALYRRAGGGDGYAALGAGQRGWALGANPWGLSFLIGAGTTSPRCPHHQVANLTGGQLTGAVVNGPNKAKLLRGLHAPGGAHRCAGVAVEAYDGGGAAYRDDVAAWPTGEAAIDYTATAVLALALS
ncbi:hydrolase [Pilimelia terevasa]|uniref:Hydrolase n=1 Tax=Pilimelia terevasa TaxID=53372 RepID=A0A8J3FJE4_9ACTN|nr:glycoside hydrolase family 9 protein [Pilimelia terevasa]GGK28770.1 hydrolase [Pilimelia terevasa]